jgi:hypothetical protein
LGANSIKQGAVKNCLSPFLVRLAVGCVLITPLAYAQTDGGAAIVSPPSTDPRSTEAIQPNNIQPGTPAAPDATADAAIVADPATLLPDPPPVPHKNATLVGGTLERLDRVRDKVTVRVFGGGRVDALFDPRTHVYRGQKEVTIADLRQGERIYLDTILDGTTVFAKTIRLNAAAAAGESQGILLNYKADELTIRDGLSPNAVRIRLTPSTKFVRDGRTVPASTLTTGSLISVNFDSTGNGHDVAREISILALPGTHYTFVGQVAHIDLRTGLLVLNSSIDHKTYEIYLDSRGTPDDNLQTGATVTVVANFENSKYVARSVTVNSEKK